MDKKGSYKDAVCIDVFLICHVAILQKLSFAVFAFGITNINNKISHYCCETALFDVNTLKFRDEMEIFYFFCIRNGNIRYQIFLIN